MTTKTSASPPGVESVGGTDPAGFPPARAILESSALLLGLGAALGREATTLIDDSATRDTASTRQAP